VNQGFVENLDQNWASLSAHFRKHCLELAENDFSHRSVESAMNDFIYWGHLLQQRLTVPAWSKLELMFDRNDEE
jgi:hypothetical protein